MAFNTIVVGIDGSDHAQRALSEAAELALASGGTIHLVCGVHYPSAHEVAETLRQMPEEFRNAYDAMATERDVLTAAGRYLESRGVSYDGDLFEGHPAEVIVDEAERHDADLIVIGSRGLGRATRLLRGSVSHHVANHADRSVLIVK
jgi:nucleotide-binding universal stress UspA family protein